jgi:hypothetical protein
VGACNSGGQGGSPDYFNSNIPDNAHTNTRSSINSPRHGNALASASLTRSEYHLFGFRGCLAECEANLLNFLAESSRYYLVADTNASYSKGSFKDSPVWLLDEVRFEAT